MVMLSISQTIILSQQLSHSKFTIMKQYIEPITFVIYIESSQVLCASFDSLDHTERWEFDDTETI